MSGRANTNNSFFKFDPPVGEAKHVLESKTSRNDFRLTVVAVLLLRENRTLLATALELKALFFPRFMPIAYNDDVLLHSVLALSGTFVI